MFKMLNKKGFVFSIVTIFLFMSIFLLTITFSNRLSEKKYDLIETGIFEKLRYIEDDVLGNVYNDLLNLNLTEIKRSGSNLDINFTGFVKLHNNIDYDLLFNNYKTFIENNYSELNNIRITLINFSDNLIINPYNSSIDFDENDFYIYNNPINLNSLSFIVKVNELNYSTLTENIQAGSLKFNLIVINQNDQIIYNSQYLLDDSLITTISFDFTGNNLDFEFGNSADFHLTTDLYTEINDFSLSFVSSLDPVYLSNGNISIQYSLDEPVKNGRIIILEE